MHKDRSAEPGISRTHRQAQVRTRVPLPRAPSLLTDSTTSGIVPQRRRAHDRPAIAICADAVGPPQRIYNNASEATRDAEADACATVIGEVSKLTNKKHIPITFLYFIMILSALNLIDLRHYNRIANRLCS